MLNFDLQKVLYYEWFHTSDREYANQLMKITSDIPIHPKLKLWCSNIEIRKKLPPLMAPFLILLFIFAIFWKLWGVGGYLTIFILIPLSLVFLSLIWLMIKIGKLKTLADGIKINPLAHQRKQPRKPYISEVENALRTLWQSQQQKTGNISPSLQKIRDILTNIETSSSPEKYRLYLNSLHWENRFLARHALIYYGAEALDNLRHIKSNRGKIQYWIMENITAATQRFSENTSHIVCPDCLSKFSKHKLTIIPPDKYPTLSYFACRMCKQSKDTMFIPGKIIAVIDRNMSARHYLENDHLFVNWLMIRNVFDFDQVEILNAKDADVEKFCNLINGDTDSIRKPRYKNITCTIRCRLSIMNIKVLEGIFEKVSVELHRN